LAIVQIRAGPRKVISALTEWLIVARSRVVVLLAAPVL